MSDFSFFYKNLKSIFFCGIGGVSMLGLAVFARKNGCSVQGSEVSPTEKTIQTCRENSIPLYFSHSAENVCGCDTFVYTAAIDESNCELERARALGMRIFSRSEFLGAIVDGFSDSFAVSGTHGKSTVTNMLYSVFSACGVRPTLFAGADAMEHDAMIMGADDRVIYEACEYNRSFLDMHPKNAVILNIEREHTDIYPEITDSEQAFFKFASNCKNIILNYNSPSCLNIEKQLKKLGVKTHFFSLDRTRNALFAENIREERGFYTFDAMCDDAPIIKDIKLSLPGLHNVSNALAVIRSAQISGLNDPISIKCGIESFKGLRRRFEYIGSVNGADVYDDYAHHPTEIKAAIQTAIKLGYKKTICAFQPHTYSRTYAFWNEFITAFEGCDEVILTDIYPARETNIYGVSSFALAKMIKNGKYIKSFAELEAHLIDSSNPQTLILTMGAGKLNEVAKKICSKN